MNTRDIRELLRGRIDPRLGKVLIAQQEDIAALKQQVMTLAGLFDQLVNNQISIANATKELTALRPLAQKMKQMGMEVSSDPSLTGEYDQ
jgi:uncharacterized coiled-coil protein SlyX